VACSNLRPTSQLSHSFLVGRAELHILALASAHTSHLRLGGIREGYFPFLRAVGKCPSLTTQSSQYQATQLKASEDMPLDRYGVWKGKIVRWEGKAKPDHGYLHFTDSTRQPVHAAVNVKSSSDDSRLAYWFYRNFSSNLPLVQGLKQLESGFHEQKGPDSLALDFLRGGYVDLNAGVLLSREIPGENNDLLDFLNPILNQAKAKDADLYIFGQQFEGEDGIHDVHMNQGNRGRKSWIRDNGIYQDGGIILAFPDGHWEAIFLAFAVQAYHTNGDGDKAGHPADDSRLSELLKPGVPTPGGGQGGGGGTGTTHPKPEVFIEAALINPTGPDQTPTSGSGEKVYLHNSSTEPVSLDGWSISNAVQGQTQTLHGVNIPAQASLGVALPKTPLSNKGGTIVLRDKKEEEIHRVVYSRDKAAREGVLVYF